MKNITVTVSDELYHAARIKAAQQHTTVSALVRNHLQDIVASKVDPYSQLFADLDRLHRERGDKRLDMSENLTRDELYDRGRR